MSRIVFASILFVLIFLPSLAGALCGEEKDSVDVAVIAILASERSDKIDPRLACIAKQIREKNKELTGFQIATISRKPLVIGTQEKFDLVGEQNVAVTVLKGADDKNCVQLKIAPPRMGEITYDTCCGKFMPLFTKYRTKNNELLIIAVSVRTCRK
jgi:hypothetical protein